MHQKSSLPEPQASRTDLGFKLMSICVQGTCCHKNWKIKYLNQNRRQETIIEDLGEGAEYFVWKPSASPWWWKRKTQGPGLRNLLCIKKIRLGAFQLWVGCVMEEASTLPWCLLPVPYPRWLCRGTSLTLSQGTMGSMAELWEPCRSWTITTQDAMPGRSDKMDHI
jgi:hypothetical protein